MKNRMQADLFTLFMAAAALASPAVTPAQELQDLIDAAEPGAVIQLEEKFYEETIHIDKPLSLVGTGFRTTRIRVLSDEPAITIRGAEGVELRDLSVIWSQKSTDLRSGELAAIYVRDSTATLTHVHMEPYDRPLETPVGLLVAGRSDVTYDAGAAHNFAYTILYTDGAGGTVSNSLITAAGHSVVTLHEGSTVEIIGNVLGECRYHAVRNTGGTMDMRNNIVFNNARAGAYLGNKPARGVIENNLFTGSQGEIWSYYDSSVRIANNAFLSSRGPAIGTWRSCDLPIEGNLFAGNPVAIQVYPKGEAGNIAPVGNHYFSNGEKGIDAPEDPAASEGNPGFEDLSAALLTASAVPQGRGLSDPAAIKETHARWAPRLFRRFELTIQDQSAKESAAAAVPPRIVATIPPIGATDVDPNLEAIEVIFDRDMAEGFSWTGGGRNHPALREGATPHWRDRRTCVYPVSLQPGTFYRVGINWGTQYSNFRSAAGVPTETRTIQFTTRGASEEETAKLAVPDIVSMDPPNGATDVDPTRTELSVTFSVPMGPGYSFTGGGENYPRNAPENPARWSDDGRTIHLSVELKPNWDYVLGINSFDFKNFSSAHGVPAEPVVWRFSTGE